jgi:type IX secretion system PorP/SprF family membrane protein
MREKLLSYKVISKIISKVFRKIFSGIALLFFIGFLQFYAQAQDIHFTQFWMAPLNLSPANTGNFSGIARFNSNQRTQWRSITTPFRTFGLSADANLAFLDRYRPNFDERIRCAKRRSRWNAGASFYKDITGDSRFTTNMFKLAVCEESSWGNTTLRLGAQFGITGMNINYSQLKYDSQWNGLVYDENLPANEVFGRNQIRYFDLSAGAVLHHNESRNDSWEIGYGIYNITSPKVTWKTDALVQLDKRHQLFGHIAKPISNKISGKCQALYMQQGKYSQFNINITAEYQLESRNWMYRSIYAGLAQRVKDATYLLAGMQYDNWNVGISYDINLSNLKPASNARGGFEFSLQWILPPDPIICTNKKICIDYY